MSRVTVIDYGMGNLFSVRRALEFCGAEVEFTDIAAGIERAERLVLPGVGAFRDGMEGLRSRGLIVPLWRYAASGRPLLGICLGMQMLLERSSEFGDHEGLGLIPGSVEPIPTTGPDGAKHKVPHIGWNALFPPDHSPARWQGTLLESTPPGEPAYFVHSFNAVPAREPDRLADCDYHGVRIAAALHSANIQGCQFHPEKSGPAGLRILARFLAG